MRQLILLLVVALAACSGDAGPTGPAGPAGAQGPQGLPGTPAAFGWATVVLDGAGDGSILFLDTQIETSVEPAPRSPHGPDPGRRGAVVRPEKASALGRTSAEFPPGNLSS